MIDFVEAYAIAKRSKSKSGINACNEYEKGYVFYKELNLSENEEPPAGGVNAPCVVLKANGEVVPMPVFVMNGTGKWIGGIDVETGKRFKKEED